MSENLRNWLTKSKERRESLYKKSKLILKSCLSEKNQKKPLIQTVNESNFLSQKNDLKLTGNPKKSKKKHLKNLSIATDCNGFSKNSSTQKVVKLPNIKLNKCSPYTTKVKLNHYEKPKKESKSSYILIKYTSYTQSKADLLKIYGSLSKEERKRPTS